MNLHSSLRKILFTFSFLGSLIGHASDNHELDRLAQGWPASFQILTDSLPTNRSYLVVLAQLPRAYVDLRSAEHLRRSLLATPPWRLKDNEMGHLGFGWNCVNSKSPWKHGFTSQSGDYSHQTIDMITHGWGLAGLNSTFTDGILLSPQQNESTHIQPFLMNRDHQMITMIQEVDDRDCEKVIGFIKDYVEVTPDRPFPARGNYGLTLSPAQLEGGACNSLSITALSLGQFFGSAGEKMYRRFGLPSHLMGRPRELKAEYVVPFINNDLPVGQEIPFKRLLNDEWTYHGQGPQVEMADTELMILFLRTVFEQSLQSKSMNFIKRIRALLPYRRWMFSRQFNQSFEEQPGILSQEIDENYDEKAAEISRLAKDWYRQKIQNGYELQRVPWGVQEALILKRPSL